MINIRDIIKKYINFLTPDHIKKYASSKDIYLTDDENNIIYEFIMDNYNDLLIKEDTVLKLKPYLREEIFEKVVNEYIKNKTKYL